MAVTQTTRLNIYRWSSGADSFTRSQLDASHAQLEALAAGFLQDTTRPPASAEYLGFIFLNTATDALSYCDGTQWIGLNTFGTPSNQLLTDSVSDGVSTDVARSDHKHGFPGFGTPVDIATSNQAGTADTLARSDHQHRLVETFDASAISSGTLDQAQIPYLPASRINSGILNIARIPNIPATKITSGDLPDARAPERIKITFAGAERSSRIYVNTNGPSGGQAYDIWIEY